MAVDARKGLFGDGRILVDGRRSRVHRDTGGWYIVEDSAPPGAARVLYREVQDFAVIQWSSAILRLPFQGGDAHFDWDRRPYRITTAAGERIRIDQEGRPVAEGCVTATGVQLESVATELLPIIRPLAWVLVLRSEFHAPRGRVPAPAHGPSGPTSHP